MREPQRAAARLTKDVLLMGMGYDVLSMNATNLPRIKWVVRNISIARARRILAKALKMDDSLAIERFMHAELMDAGLGRVVPRHRSHLATGYCACCAATALVGAHRRRTRRSSRA